MKKTFIVAMFIFWGFVVSVISASYIVKQNRIAQETLQQSIDAKIILLKSQILNVDKDTKEMTQSTSAPTTTATKTSTSNTSTLKTSVSSNKPTQTQIPTTTPSVSSPPNKTTLTLTIVSEHNTSTDCWLVISNKVYSVASYIPMHPGGRNRIINDCGTDATSDFTGTSGGHRHSGYAFSLLGQYLVGDLQ